MIEYLTRDEYSRELHHKLSARIELTEQLRSTYGEYVDDELTDVDEGTVVSQFQAVMRLIQAEIAQFENLVSNPVSCLAQYIKELEEFAGYRIGREHDELNDAKHLGYDDRDDEEQFRSHMKGIYAQIETLRLELATLRAVER